MRRARFSGFGLALAGGGLTVLLAIIKHPPHWLYIVGWALLGIGLLMLLMDLIVWIRHHNRPPPEDPQATQNIDVEQNVVGGDVNVAGRDLNQEVNNGR